MHLGAAAHILVAQFGGMGDLVLISELIGSLKSGHPERRVTLACRAEFAAIASLFVVGPDEVIALDLNPYLAGYPSDELRLALEKVVHKFDGFGADILIDGSLRPSWLTWFLTSLLHLHVNLCCSGVGEPEVMLSIIRDWFGLARCELIDLGPPAPGMHERGRYGMLLDHLGVPRVSEPRWRPQPEWEAHARHWLDANGLPLDGFVVCFPGGAATTLLKRWPRQNFIQIIDLIQAQGFPVLLLGESGEREELTSIARQTARPVPLFCGDSANLPLAAAVLSKATAYLGNDTGPMHLAQAYGVSGVAIFGGGGQWPRYAPWATGSIALVHPLPCFGCDWDCFLGRGLCVESVPVEAVATALLSTMATCQEPRIVSVESSDSAILPVLADASARYRVVQRDRERRMEIILELTRDNERLKAAESRANRTQADDKSRIGDLERTADERLVLIQAVHSEASGYQEGLKRLTAEIADRDRRIAALHAIAQERLTVLERIASGAAARQSSIEELTIAVRERESTIGGLKRELAAQTRDDDL
jgi:ADP-heptose:LPS heptosyltransferase